MSAFALLFLSVTALGQAATSTSWTLAEHFDSLFVYDNQQFREFAYGDKEIRAPNSAMLKQVAGQLRDGKPRPLLRGIEVGGELRPGQLLFSGASPIEAAVVEFVVEGGTKLQLDYGLADHAHEKRNSGSLLAVEVYAGEQVQRQAVKITENRWSTLDIALPQAERVLVRLAATRRGNESVNWACIVLRGDGRLGTRQQARDLSANCQKVNRIDLTLSPSPHRVVVRPGYDILFYRDQPWVSYAVKGYPAGSHEQQVSVGVNTYYQEGLTFTPYWSKGADGVEIKVDSPLCDQLRGCQKFDLPFKSSISMAHCSPFLPPWLVTKENLGLEGHKLRRGGATHTSFIKPATLRFHQTGLEGWVKPFLDQPTVFVLGQEEDGCGWDDYSPEAVASWQAWLRRRFNDRWDAFSQYVGGVKEIDAFDHMTNPKRFQPDPRFGYPMRLAYLKLQWITDSYTEYMGQLLTHLRRIAPGVPLTQRYVNWAGGADVCRRLNFDYNYSYGHLSVEGTANKYGIGQKSWSGIYAHMGTLPLPRGGSIGKAYSRDIRRGPMNETEWRLNAYTLVANGCCGFEYSTLTPSWGPSWEPSALMDRDFQLTPTGQAGQKVMREVLAMAPYMLHYEQPADVAVFHDASFNSGPLAGAWGQSKVGLYTLIRECNFHPDPLGDQEMTAEKLRGRKVLVLAGSLSIAPEIQEAVRQYVREGGVLLTFYCADGQGLPGCNSYDYACNPRQSARAASFEEPKAVAHLGDVLGVRQAAGVVRRKAIRVPTYGDVSLEAFNALVDEGKWIKTIAAAETFVPLDSAKVLATFDDGSPAAIEHRFGKGRAVTIALDLGVIANNLTIPGLYGWWSDLLAAADCRRAVDTANPFVEGGAWHDDQGRRLVLLINHDLQRPQEAILTPGQKVRLEPGQALSRVLERQ